MVSGGGAVDPDGNRLQNSSCSPRHWGHSMHVPLCGCVYVAKALSGDYSCMMQLIEVPWSNGP